MTEVVTNEVTKLLNDLSKPSLHALSYSLRHPDTWPKDFVWNYSNCNNCAMGLAHALWNSIPEPYMSDGPSIMAREFAMGYGAAKSIFLGSSAWVPQTVKWGLFSRIYTLDFESVTPEMVADQIDTYLATVA